MMAKIITVSSDSTVVVNGRDTKIMAGISFVDADKAPKKASKSVTTPEMVETDKFVDAAIENLGKVAKVKPDEGTNTRQMKARLAHAVRRRNEKDGNATEEYKIKSYDVDRDVYFSLSKVKKEAKKSDEQPTATAESK